MRALPIAAVLALLAPQLGGCVAAIVPLAASGALTKRTVDSKREGKKVKPVVIVGKGSAPSDQLPIPPELAPEPTADPVLEVAPGLLAEPRTLKPQGVMSTARLALDDAGYAAMTEFVLAAMGDGKPVLGRNSALLDQSSLATLPQMETCGDQRPALLIDLDPGDKPFDVADPPTPDAELAANLRTIRGRGVAVVWMASLPESAERDVLTIVKATGLDPLGIDRTLLLRESETRKQQLLNRADEEWCVLAVAGDRRADFDEVFDYLRNPDGPVALALEQHIGAGWFLVPPPIR